MNSTALASSITTAVLAPPEERQRLADRIFRFAVAINLVLTLVAFLPTFTGVGETVIGKFQFNFWPVVTLIIGFAFFNVFWAFVWYGVKAWLLRSFVGMSREDREIVFSSRMSQPFDLAGLLTKYPERRIRITDMIGRRGRFITLAMTMFFFLYMDIAAKQSDNFAYAFGAQTLVDSVFSMWVFIAFYRSNGVLAAGLFGAQTRIMDGTLARANFMLIVTLWSLFKFALVPIGAELQALYPPGQFAMLFALIWGTYLVVDTFAEVGGSLYGTMKIRVRGVGDVNRKSIGGTVTGLIAGLVFSLGIVWFNGLSGAYLALAVAVSVASSALEVCSPRGTDDFTMATGNALICWAFGAWLL
jgi:hypothetical protein